MSKTSPFYNSKHSGLDSVPPESSKKTLGRYYTPAQATRILCSWAIQHAEDKVLEPSFGACGFLESAFCRFVELGTANPRGQLYGCDIDKEAFDGYLKPRLGIEKNNSHFLLRDFLGVQPAEFGVQGLDVVVGNPPYVSYHNMSKQTRKAAEQAAKRDGFKLTARASLWAFFVLHAIYFIRSGGRMALVLPGSFLFAEYASDVRDHVAKHFRRTLLVQLGQRLFLSEGTEELSVVLLADGRRPEAAEKGQVSLDFANRLSDLEKQIKSWSSGSGSARVMDGRAGTAFLSDKATNGIRRVARAGQILHIGAIADVVIGIVTGANSFFVLNHSLAQSQALDDAYLSFILAKFSLVRGASLTSTDLEHARHQDRRCLLLNTNHQDLNRRGSELRRYLATIPLAERRKNLTFKKRALWHRPDDSRIPDAFFPYMYQHGPRLILNEAGTTSTNNIHRVYFRADSCPHGVLKETWHKTCAISILSTFSQLSGELQGRCYGGGVLKHEPSEARQIRLVIPESVNTETVNTVFRQIDAALRENQDNDARSLADLFVFQALEPSEREELIVTLECALIDARRRRVKSDKDKILTRGG